ncbi:tripartite-type tricarboxylate transporter receptor subunit TctC [Jezberella montanilacus]|jgi:tripartite-type tricarboxylate transporter receptor subunit TctC|uniref:Tripartite-type tricarboxylate transporter receptor subunit TctC n=1 Tax=Jezberella montanilacus TaxID=323426 RepID=A0A2T0XC54_9BURK|nr:tripartite-type tricarboxylate transporter receptor subunit TctC [Jezberella montanilacus]
MILQRLFLLILCLLGLNCEAQDYPNKPIRLIVPFATGGGNDAVARVVAQQLGVELKQSVIVENRPGAGGAVGAETAARSAADGYTLFLGGVGSLSVNPNLFSKLPYDPIKDFEPIILIASAPSVLVVYPAFAATDVRSLIALAKKDPGKINFASNGNGSSAHIAAVMFTTQSGVDLVHVPYKGLAPALNDLLVGRVDLMFSSIVAIIPQIQAGKLRALAVTGKHRAPLLPEVPTLAEAGLPDYQAGSWYGLLAPAGTPQDILSKIQAASTRVLTQESVRAQLVSEGAEAIGGSSAEFAAHIQSEYQRMHTVIRDGRIQMD